MKIGTREGDRKRKRTRVEPGRTRERGGESRGVQEEGLQES